MVYGSSGPAETAAENAAAKAFTRKTGIPVTAVASPNETESLAEGFAGGDPPNVFYLSPTLFNTYVREGVLYSYASKLPNAKDFSPGLASAFTYKNALVCAPKDGSALALYVNTADWKAAHLTAADYPKNWAQLATVAKRLTVDGRVGLSLDANESRIDAFLYQNGGKVINSAGTKVFLDSKANIQALSFLKGMLVAHTLAFPATLSQPDATDAFGLNKAAMIITGPWMEGGMSADYPKVPYSVHLLPAGPTGINATLTFTNCWGVSKTNDNIGGTIEYVEFLTSAAQELRFTKEFGTIPSLTTVAGEFDRLYSKNAAELAEFKYGHPDISLRGSTEAASAYSSLLANLATVTPQSILSAAQRDFQEVIGQNKNS
jgi:multiple sugar transport system substrate-binding protein